MPYKTVAYEFIDKCIDNLIVLIITNVRIMRSAPMLCISSKKNHPFLPE